MKAAVVTSVLLLLFFGYTVNKVHSAAYVPEPAYLSAIPVPMPLIRKEIAINDLLDKLPQDRQVFRQVFFEVMKLQGLQKTRSGSWLAIFADAKGNLMKLGAGDTHDGVRIESVDSVSCTVRYGSIERKFDLP
jgi:hypothetical protein